MKLAKTYYDVTGCRANLQAHEGGTRSGKTYSIITALIELCFRNKGQGIIIDICRVNGPALEDGPMKDFQDILLANGWYNPGWNAKRRKYNLWGNEVRFFSVDQAYKMRGRKRHILYLNEANRFPYESWQQLFMRTTDRIIMDWNPNADSFWGYDLIAERGELFTSSYKDNPFLGKKQIEAIESMQDTDPWYWAVYGLGERASNPATIYRRWEVRDKVTQLDDGISKRPPKPLCIGLDFGFSADPAALVLIADGLEGQLVLTELLYEHRLTNPELAERIKAALKQHNLEDRFPVVCDSAEPKSIEELRRAGVNAYAAQKGPDSVRQGIQLVQQFKLLVVGSENLQKELRQYRWRSDANGNVLSKPKDANDHLMDALRYGVTWAKQSKYTGTYFVN